MIWFVGAGCYHPDYLTQAATYLIKQCDCILYDALIDQDILNLAKPSCEKIYVGKIGHKMSTNQSDIFSLLVEKGYQYKNVVRLKGGDPFVFGRGSEEMDHVLRNGLCCQYVPGISSAIGAAGFAGIPVTHRELARSFHVYTAHAKNNEDILDYQTIAHTEGTHIFFMAHSKIKTLVENLLTHGMDPSMPIALCSKVTYPDQAIIVSNLKDISTVNVDDYPSPMLVIISKTVDFSSTLSNANHLSKFSKRVLIASIDDTDFPTEKLRLEYGVYPTIVQAASIHYEKKPIDLDSFFALAFTSKHGIIAFMENLFDQGLDARALHDKKIYCIGKKTADHLKKYGLICDGICKESNAKGFNAYLNQFDNVLIISPKPEKYDHKTLSLYSVVSNDIILPSSNFDACIATCPASVKALATKEELKSIPLYCYAHATKQEAARQGFKIIIPCKSSKEDMIQTLIETL